MPQKLTDDLIEAAIEGYESQKVRIDQKIAELRSMRSGNHTGTAAEPEAEPRKLSKFSAAARKRMALAQKARWAKIKGESTDQPATTKTSAKPKRKMSAKARRAIGEATRKRWEAVRAAKKAAA